MMKKILSFALAMSMLVLSGCSQPSQSSGAEKTPEELTTLYADSITEFGGEMVQYNPVVTEIVADTDSAMLLEAMGLNTEDLSAFAFSSSMMNVKAYGIAAVMPAEGKEEDVKSALQSFIDGKQSSFEFYLEDQYEIACNARLETLEDGTILMVMTEGQDEVYDNISAAILEQ